VESERDAADAAKPTKTVAAKLVVSKTVASERSVAQRTAEEAAALHYMLSKELNAATQKRAELVAEDKVKKQEEALDRLLRSSKKEVEQVESKLEKAASKVEREAEAKAKKNARSAAVTKAVSGAIVSVASTGITKSAAVAGVDAKSEVMHVAKGQQKKLQHMKQQKLNDDGEENSKFDDDDIGWHKTHWSTVAWVMFIMFGPVFTTAVVGLVGYYTGTVAALATCLLLVSMDIACYYYSWFLW
jgi:hypothetical protein